MDPTRLQADAGLLGVRLDAEQADRLIRFVAELERWNARFNLVSRQDIGRIWPRHILDSLSIAPLLAGELRIQSATTVVDVGTGAGLPGLPLAIALPEVNWLLLDRNQRKTRFLETVIAALALENVTARVAELGKRMPEDLRATADIVVSRAVDEPERLLPLVEPLLRADGCLVLMTATAAADGRRHGEPGAGFAIREVRELAIPGLDRTHEVTIIDRRRIDPRKEKA